MNIIPNQLLSSSLTEPTAPEPIRIGLALSILLCALVTGLVWTFAIVVMPGIRSLNDHDFLQAFKVMDRVIQNSQPIFVLVWLGSILAIVATAVLGILQLEGLDRLLIIGAAALFILGVQLPTFACNVPLNNQLQAQNLEAMSEAELAQARKNFEPAWVRWNTFRTILGTIATALLIVLVLRL